MDLRPQTLPIKKIIFDLKYEPKEINYSEPSLEDRHGYSSFKIDLKYKIRNFIIQIGFIFGLYYVMLKSQTDPSLSFLKDYYTYIAIFLTVNGIMLIKNAIKKTTKLAYFSALVYIIIFHSSLENFLNAIAIYAITKISLEIIVFIFKFIQRINPNYYV